MQINPHRKPNQMPEPSFYRVSVALSNSNYGNYKHLHLEVIPPDYSPPSIDAKWQTHCENGAFRDWYAVSTSVKADNYTKHKIADKYLKKIYGIVKGQRDYNDSPQGVIARLEKAKIMEGIYDSRISKLVHTAAVLPDTYFRYSAYDKETDHNIISTLARGHDEALKDLWDRMRSFSDASFGAWLMNGKPIRKSFEKCTKPLALEHMLNPNFDHKAHNASLSL